MSAEPGGHTAYLIICDNKLCGCCTVVLLHINIYIYIHINVILCTVVTDNLNIVGYLISRCLDRVLYCLSIYGFFLYCKHMRLTYAR